jgi:cephalosporin hydroxylase
MNDLEKYFDENTGNAIDKWKHYFDIYDRYFSRYRGKEIHFVEFGVWHGGSLQMWKNYFGPKAKIYGVDINPACKQLEEDQVQIFIGDQADKNFLKSLSDAIPKIDILLDDGGHTMEQQINTFEALYHRIDPNGIYMCEDMHTSYWRRWGGGYRNRDSFVEYTKNFIDHIHAWHSEDKERFKVNDFTRTAYSLHFYDSILVVEKKPMEEPSHRMTGNERVPMFKPPKKKKKPALLRIFKLK